MYPWVRCELQIIGFLDVASYLLSGPTTTPSTSSTTTTSSAPSTTTSITGYAKVAAGKGVFVINGKETYFMGTNCYWCGFLTNDADVDLVMSHIAQVH
jgi:mannan endo-1,4-beta-mannosidase